MKTSAAFLFSVCSCWDHRTDKFQEIVTSINPGEILAWKLDASHQLISSHLSSSPTVFNVHVNGEITSVSQQHSNYVVILRQHCRAAGPSVAAPAFAQRAPAAAACVFVSSAASAAAAARRWTWRTERSPAPSWSARTAAAPACAGSGGTCRGRSHRAEVSWQKGLQTSQLYPQRENHLNWGSNTSPYLRNLAYSGSFQYSRYFR